MNLGADGKDELSPMILVAPVLPALDCVHLTRAVQPINKFGKIARRCVCVYG